MVWREWRKPFSDSNLGKKTSETSKTSELSKPAVINKSKPSSDILDNTELKAESKPPQNDEPINDESKQNVVEASCKAPPSPTILSARASVKSALEKGQMETDSRMYGYAKDEKEDPNEYMDMTVRERLIGEEIIRREFKDDGITSSWLDTDEEWQKNISILQEKWYNQISYILPNNNNMAGIATRYVTENELNTKMSIKELSKYVLVLDILLTDKVKRDQARRRLKKRYNFTEEQVFALIPKQTAGRKKGGALPNAPDTPDITQEAEPEMVNTCQISPKETIRDLALRIIRDNLSEVEVKAIAKALAGMAPNDSANTTRSANIIQKGNRLLRENEGIDYPDHFSLESVKERLNSYDVSNKPDKQALADVMIMLCIRPAEIKDLRIFNGNVTGYGKNWGQQDIPRVFRSLEKNEERAKQLLIWIQEAISSRQLKDPGKPGILWFNTFLKKDEFLPKVGKPLLPSSLRKLGAVYAVVSHGAKNLSEAMTIASEALRHSPDNHTSPAKNYTIVNYRLRGEPYNQATVFELSSEN
ncbi:hypothetical protein GLOIN_2v1765707 [Rhizophagus clarus]|uniref:Uncharacterized protein n=1 Tax=Rhizophagus clarus TaxID=94130 RepID=A0A8H3QWP6_9GLOM|nr:hypothetical protein GLOIN_2v1765707 [Rhizophagus clarus]